MGLQLFINLDDYNRVVESNVNRVPIRAVRLKAQSTTDIDFRFVRNGAIIPMEVGTTFRFAAKASGERDSDPVLEELNSSFTVVSSPEDWYVRMSLNTNTTAMMDLFNDDEDPTNDILLALLDAELLWDFGSRQNRTPDPFLFEMENPVIRADDLPPIDNPAEYPDPTIILTTPDLGVTVAPLVGGFVPAEFIPAGSNSPFVGATPTEDGLQGLVPAPLIADETKYLKGDGTWDTPPDTTYTNFTTTTPGLTPHPGTVTGKYLKDDGTWDTPPDTDTTYDPFVGATPLANGTEGLVPAPLIADQTKYLKGDGTWSTPAGQEYDVFTLSDDGLVPSPTTSTGRFLSDDGTWVAAAGGPLSVFGVEADGLVPGPLAGDTGTKYLKADGTWSVPPDTNTTYTTFTTSVSGLTPFPGAGAGNRYLREDGSWVVPPDTNTTYTTFTTSVAGLVPAPGSGSNRFLKEDGTWVTPTAEAAPAPTIEDNTTARTLVIGDAGHYIRFINGGPITITIPTDGGVLFPANTIIYFRRASSSAISLSYAGVTINDEAVNTIPVGGVFALKKISANTWDFL